MIAHVIGNGKSRHLYGSMHTRRPRQGTVIHCNVPDFDCDYQSIIDRKPIDWYKNQGTHPQVPVLCLNLVKSHARTRGVGGHYEVAYTHQTHRKNSGHYAAEWAAREHSTVHLWGFDSMWSKDLTSITDRIIPRHARAPLHTDWDRIWHEVVTTNPRCEFVVHAPDSHTSQLENLRYEKHD